MDRRDREVSDGKTVLDSRKDNWHIHGLGMVLNKAVTVVLIGLKPVSEHIILVRFQTRHIKTTIMQVVWTN